jgi:stage V sporulation protein R
MSMPTKPLYTGSDWTPELISAVYEAIEVIAQEELGLETYPNQLEIVSAEQMIDAYASTGLPVMYGHWSFGKTFVKTSALYRKGLQNLAYEMVINSNPAISYLMEDNSMTMQTLVIAHAAFGHNAFFRNNYIFRDWTDADAIVDYMVFAKSYIKECEERYGQHEVEAVIDACHAIQDCGVDRYKRRPKRSLAEEEKRRKEREEYIQSQINYLWDTRPAEAKDEDETEAETVLKEPQENILYFLEKNSPVLKIWQREIVRIVRKLAQYFYPQRQTKLANEGFATFVHYYIMTRLHEKGLITDGAFLEFIDSHTSVVTQRDFDSPGFSGINPYALGFAIFRDIKRMSETPTAEDERWFPEIVGRDWVRNIHWAYKDFRDESLVQQFLSPKVARDFKLFALKDEEELPAMTVTAVHSEADLKHIRKVLAEQYDLGFIQPLVEVERVNVRGNRALTLLHRRVNGVPLHEKDTERVRRYVQKLWGYKVRIESPDDE